MEDLRRFGPVFTVTKKNATFIIFEWKKDLFLIKSWSYQKKKKKMFLRKISSAANLHSLSV